MIPLFSTKQVREGDDYAINELGIPGMVLMENASLEIFNYVDINREELKLPKKIAIICGKGNNGGDGYAAARHFLNNGYEVSTVKIGEEDEMSGDCKTNYRILRNLSREE